MEDENIIKFSKLISPRILREDLCRKKHIEEFVSSTRNEIKRILNGVSKKKLFIVGPCSIHNVIEAIEYGKMLKKLSEKVEDKILIVMRVYFEKPRTTIGWKGLINDPNLDNSYDVNMGLYLARKLLLELNELGVPCGYEVLDTITPQYISDLISWAAIGARTTESQVHRQLASGLSMPIGFKNGTGGSIKIARDAILSARYPHCFMGITHSGSPSICTTRGNSFCHIILRGGSNSPNYTSEYIKESENLLQEHKLPKAIMVDCSHGNSRKIHTNQKIVLANVIQQMRTTSFIIGVMIESNINEGKQTLGEVSALKYGVSITDACISIEETEKIIIEAYDQISSFGTFSPLFDTPELLIL